MFQDVGGIVLPEAVIPTMALIPLKPYFQGTTSLRGAPSWFGQIHAVQSRWPAASRGCMASSILSPSR